MQVVGFTREPADPAGHRALGRPGGRRRDRHGGERRAPPARGQDARCRRRSTRARELVGPIIAMTITLAAVYAPDRHPGRPDRRAVPRVRVHAGRRGDRLRRRGADAVADDVLASCCAPATPSAASPASSTAGSSASSTPTRGCWRWTLRYRPVVLTAVGDRHAADRAVLHVLAAGAGARRGSGRRLRHRPGVRQRDARADQALHRRRSTTSSSRFPSPSSSFQITLPERRLRRHGDQAVEPADARRSQQLLMEVDGTAVADPGVRVIPLTPPPLPGRRRLPGRVRDRLDGRAAAALRRRQPARAEGVRERHVHVRRHRPEVRPAADRDRLRPRQAALARASTCSQAGRDLSTLLGGNYVNRFNIQAAATR